MSNPKEVLYEAAETKRQIDELQAKYDGMQDSIIQAVVETAPDTMKVDVGELGRFSISQRRVWEYSDDIKDLEQLVAEKKDTEKQVGTATVKEIPMLKFMPHK